MDLRNAVHLAGHIHRKIGHARLIIADDVEIRAGELLLQALFDLQENVADLRHNTAQKIHIPALERFAHDGVVRVGNRSAHLIPRLVPAEAVFVHHDAHKLGNDERRVRIVYLDPVVL